LLLVIGYWEQQKCPLPYLSKASSPTPSVLHQPTNPRQGFSILSKLSHADTHLMTTKIPQGNVTRLAHTLFSHFFQLGIHSFRLYFQTVFSLWPNVSETILCVGYRFPRKISDNQLARLAIATLAAGVLTLGSVHDASAAKTGGRVGGQAFRSPAPRSAPRVL